MCRTSKVVRHCECGEPLYCQDLWYCRPCFEHWMDVDDSEMENA